MAKSTGMIISLLLFLTSIVMLLENQLWTSLTETPSQWWSSIWHADSPPCACHRCVTDDDDQWFMKRFNTSLNPFLTLDNTLSEHDFRWWTNLQQGPKTFLDYRVAEMDVLEMFPEKESFMDSRPGRCRTCAVVGNSNNLLGSHYGAEIDFHDVVMRFNRARIVGYEEDVGNKTTLQLMYPESAVVLNNNTHLMFVPFKTHDLQWLVRAFTPHSIKQTYQRVKIANQDLVKVLHPGFIKYVHESWLEKHGKYPSTGFLGVVLAIHICDEVNVYGFGADKDGNWKHYWDNPGVGIHGTGPHGGGQENKLILQLAERRKVNFYKGW